jgi:excisionase family DNA binding protein
MKRVIGELVVYDVAEVASVLDMQEETIREYIRFGKLRANKVGRKYWIDEADLQSFVRGESSHVSP